MFNNLHSWLIRWRYAFSWGWTDLSKASLLDDARLLRVEGRASWRTVAAYTAGVLCRCAYGRLPAHVHQQTLEFKALVTWLPWSAHFGVQADLYLDPALWLRTIYFVRPWRRHSGDRRRFMETLNAMPPEQVRDFIAGARREGLLNPQPDIQPQLSHAARVVLWLYTRPDLLIGFVGDRVGFRLGKWAQQLDRASDRIYAALPDATRHYELLTPDQAADFDADFQQYNPRADAPVIRRAALSVAATLGGLAAMVALLVFVGPLAWGNLHAFSEYMRACVVGWLK